MITSTTVLIKGFTITPSLDPSLNDFEAGIYIWSDSYNCTIMDCVIANFDNTVSPGTLYGIRLDGTQCTVRRNIIRNNIYGMYCHRALGNGDNIIDENILTNNQLGIYCVHDSQDGNNIKLAYGNNITENIGGINCFGSRLNKFYHNNFLDNEYCARTFGYPQIWDDGYPSGGNYWNDYTGEDLDGDGIGDTSYIIDENNRDNYPFINPWTPQAYDVATLGVIPYKNVVGQGFSLRINVTVENQGFYTQTFNIAAYANDTAIQTQTVTISSGNFTTVTFTWNTTGVSYSNYSISASASTVPGEIDTGDNTLVDGIVFVTITGDVNGDGEVDASDLLDLGTAYGPDPSKPNWNPNSDFNDDDKVDASDLFALSKNYGKTI